MAPFITQDFIKTGGSQSQEDSWIGFQTVPADAVRRHVGSRCDRICAQRGVSQSEREGAKKQRAATIAFFTLSS